MIDTDKYEGHTPGPWKAIDGNIPLPDRTDKLKHGGVALADRLPEMNYPPFVSYHDDIIIWSEDLDGSMTSVYYEEMLANTRLAMAAPDLLAEVKRLRERLDKVEKECGALWSITNNWSMCVDDYTMHDQYENLDERYADTGYGIILKELYTYTEEDGWQPKEMIE